MSSPAKRPAEEPAGAEAKKPRTDLALIRKQIEYYFSDENLKNDLFFHEKISADSDGWLDLKLIQSCNKIKNFKAADEVLLEALKDSPLETKTEGGNFVRRTTPLPELNKNAGAKGGVRKGQDAEAKKKTAHDGGVLVRFKDLPEDLTWHKIKDEMRKLLPESARILFATNVSEKKTCVMLLAPFDNDVELVEPLEVKVEEKKLSFEVCYGELLRECIKELPKHIVKRREALAKNRQKQRQKPVLLAGQKFANMSTLRGKMKEIIMSRKDGQTMIDGSPDTMLVRAVIAHHPRAAEKLVGVKGLKVDVSSFEPNTPGGKKSRCFYLVKEDGTSEDISMIKCLGEIERKVLAGELEGPKEAAKEAATTPKSPVKSPAKSPVKAEVKAEVKTEVKTEVKAEAA